MRAFVVAAFASLLAASAAAQGQVASRWVQLMPGGGQEARALTQAAACPALDIDGVSTPMAERAPPDDYFPLHLCALVIPAKAKLAMLEGTRLPLLAAKPQRIVVFGDTGCRIKGGAIQDCNDPKKWPFPEIAAKAAQLKPDLVIHVGDYLYREAPCPEGDKRCAGTPHGDNGAAWDADFFAPAAPLLAAAPWVIVRGNHEDCARSGKGFLRLLGPDAVNPVAGCREHIPLYSIPLGNVNLAVLDDTDAPDTTIDADLRTEYEADFKALQGMSQPVWLVGHRPLWGAVTLYGMAMGGNRTLIATLPGTATLRNTALMLSGHIHTFEALNYENTDIPPQLIAGFGGDALDSAPADLTGTNISGTRVKDGISIGGFGFLLMTQERNGWRIDVHEVDGSIERVCRFADRRLVCPKA